MNTESFEVNESKAKEFGKKLTIAMRLHGYERMEDAAEAFVGLFEGENIVAIDKFIEHVRIVHNRLNNYYDTKRQITSEVLNISRERRRSSLRSNPDKDRDQNLHGSIHP